MMRQLFQLFDMLWRLENQFVIAAISELFPMDRKELAISETPEQAFQRGNLQKAQFNSYFN